MSKDQSETTKVHIETQASHPVDVFSSVCRDAINKEKCQEFVDRLGEASRNIVIRDS